MQSKQILFNFPQPASGKKPIEHQAPPGLQGLPSDPREQYVPVNGFVATPEKETTGKKFPRPGLLALGAIMFAAATAAVLTGPFGPSVTPEATVVSDSGSGKTSLQETLQGPATLEKVDFGAAPGVRAFGPAAGKVELKPEGQVFPNGAGYTLTYEGTRLEARGANESLLDGDQSNYEFLQAFQNEGESNWRLTSTMKPAGGTAELASVSVLNEYEAGGPPNQTVELATFEIETGQRMHLKNLVGEETYNHILSTITQELGKRPAGVMYNADAQTLDTIVDQSFAVYQGKDGSRFVTVAVPGQAEASEGTVAEFTFKVPSGSF
ncbi:MAG: hypothetical protein AB1758_16170 [Candidatus Eremiobacterota bacterium]